MVESQMVQVSRQARLGRPPLPATFAHALATAQESANTPLLLSKSVEVGDSGQAAQSALLII